ncbi:hypothetical protein AAGW05_16920 [Arthrobacter sp. LAPM80]|uniref:hypothetical protein n=1 Tax=Arthrobacter sp. LAPM80 TaxID=3141788 RepID=UPI00398B65A5
MAVVTAKFENQLAELRQASEDRIQHESDRHEREFEQLRARLRDLATINVDMACEVPELKALVTELQLENARLLHDQHAYVQELSQISGRLFELSSRLGLPLDKTTKEIFQRRGWRTETLLSKP